MPFKVVYSDRGRNEKDLAMTRGKQRSAERSHPKAARDKARYADPDHRYFSKHLGRLVRERPGEWIVLAEGNLIGIAKKESIRSLIREARSRYPRSIPFIAPIPAKEDLECVL